MWKGQSILCPKLWDIFDLTAVLALEEGYVNSLRVALGGGGIDVVVRKPLDGLVLELYVTELFSSKLFESSSVFLCICSCVKLNSSSSSGGDCGVLGSSLAALRTAAAGSKTESKGKS